MNSLMTLLRRSGVTISLALMLASCSKAPFLTPPTLALVTMSAADKVNVDIRGRSTPVVVRYYLLKNDSAFNSADFFSLYDKDQQTLGDAIVAREEFVLKPGETKNFEPKDASQAQVFAVFAQFRNIDKGVWRATAPLPAKTTTAIAVTLSNDQVTLVAKSR